MKVGVIHGRFQLLHNDHLHYLLAGKKRCDHLVIGITNPDPTLTKTDPADLERSSEQANPFTYYERYLMVREALVDEGLGDEITIVPFPVNFPNLYRYYVPLDAVFFLSIYDGWGEKKLQMFRQLGLTTEILWRKSLADKGLSARVIRARVAANEAWRHLVPPAVARLVDRLGLQKRIAGHGGIEKGDLVRRK
ncbi:MAG: nicotinate-nucleotide adenylyltransferase [Thermodesulfobacteriota bacterium]